MSAGVLVAAHLAAQVQPTEATDHGQRLMAVGGNGGGGVRLARGGGQAGINRLPGGLEEATEDGLAGGEDGGLQLVQGRGGLESGEVRQGQVDGGEFGYQVGGQVV